MAVMIVMSQRTSLSSSTSNPSSMAQVGHSSPRNPQDNELRQQLQARLLSLPFTAFACCVGDLLTAEGYRNIRLAGRAWYRGRNKEGGYDLEASLPSKPSNRTHPAKVGRPPHQKVIVQIKQFAPDLRVYVRTFDELRGACLRTGAAEALLVTTSAFSPTLRKIAAALCLHSNVLAPVHLIDGDELVDRLIHQKIGIYEEGGDCTVDEAYFDHLSDGGRPLQRKSRGVGTPVRKTARSFVPRAGVCSTHHLPVRHNHRRLSATFSLTLPLDLLAGSIREGKKPQRTKKGDA